MERVLVFGLVFASVGGAATLVAFLLYRRHRRILGRLTTTQGTIVETLESDVDGQTMFRPVVEFTPAGSTESFRATESTYHGAVRWQIGDAHVVYYDPRSPSTNQLSRRTGHMFGAEMLCIFGVTFLALGIAALVGYALGPESAFGRFVRTAVE